MNKSQIKHDIANANAVSLEIENVRHSFGGALALDNVSLSVAAGETVCLLGHSGCGKTTMLRVAAGVERPDAGIVRLGGKTVTGPDTFVPPEARSVGLMFQDYALFPHLTILGNVLFGMKGQSAAKHRTAALQSLEQVGLGRYGDDYPHMLSGGEQQRVALARALASQPGIMLMDEPFSNLDQRTREAIREQTMDLLREQRSTTVVVTHDPEEAMAIADRIAIMREGKIVQFASGEDLYHRPAGLFVARYFCDLNEFDGTAAANLLSTPIGRFEASNDVADGPCIICVRPQAITLVVAGPERLEGKIITRRFLGESDFVTIKLPGLDMPLHARLPAGFSPPPGELTGVRIDPSGILAFTKK